MQLRWGAAAVLGVAASLALAAPAAAHHNQPAVTVGDPGECGAVELSTAWTADTHTVETTALVVQAGGEQHTAPVGEAVTVGPFDAEQVTIRWRVWGGGERDYDNPPLTDLAALLDHLDDGGGVLDVDAPGVAWHELVVEGCPPASTEPPATDPPTTDPPATSTPDVSESPAPGVGAELPVTSGVSTLPALLGLGAGAVLLGGGLYGCARRRRVG